MAELVNMDIDQGEDWSLQIYWTNEQNTPQKLIEPIRMDIVDNFGAVIKTLTTPETQPAPGTIPDVSYSSEVGLIQLHLEDSVTSAMPAGKYNYDLFCTVDDGAVYAGNQVVRLIAGKVTVHKRTTQGF